MLCRIRLEHRRVAVNRCQLCVSIYLIFHASRLEPGRRDVRTLHGDRAPDHT